MNQPPSHGHAPARRGERDRGDAASAIAEAARSRSPRARRPALALRLLVAAPLFILSQGTASAEAAPPLILPQGTASAVTASILILSHGTAYAAAAPLFVLSHGTASAAAAPHFNMSQGTDSSAAHRCAAPLPVLEGGREVGRRCADDLAAAGLTAIDLGDAWAPYPLDGAATAAGLALPAYHSAYVALADQPIAAAAEVANDAALELYGIPPSFRRVLEAMDDDARHACHEAIDAAPLAAAPLPLRYANAARTKTRRRALARARARVRVLRRRHGVDDLAALSALGPAEAKIVDGLVHHEATEAAIVAIQAHLACEGLLGRPRDPGAFDWATVRALAIYQRRHWVVASGELDADTKAALLTASRELELRRALRVLRSRVTDGAGILADGSALGAFGTVLGRALDPEDLRYTGTYAPLAGGAPDRIAAATEAAAIALGWRDFASARASLRRLLAAEDRQVAVRLPPAAAYERGVLDLRVEIHAGDAMADATRGHHADPGQRPVLIVYVRDGDREVALVRWPTTFGGWKDVKRSSGAIVHRYKPSDLGPRVWQDLIVAPVWFAPASTPDADLLARRGGHWAIKDELLGPGYRSAYGLAMLIHDEPAVRDGAPAMIDHGIRTHGSVSYRSILVGQSHGCHRLYNHQMIRLTTFLLRHRAHTVDGPILESYTRRIHYRGLKLRIARSERGFGYTMTPPVPLDVLP